MRGVRMGCQPHMAQSVGLQGQVACSQPDWTLPVLPATASFTLFCVKHTAPCFDDKLPADVQGSCCEGQLKLCG